MSECKYCENFWLKYPKKQPYPLTDKLAEQVTLYQCKECGIYWEENLRTSRVISSEEAQQKISDFFRRNDKE